jgi:predicted phosphohydrolase
MRIRYLSDLHLEFLKPKAVYKFLEQISLPKSNEICVLAGDIGNIHTSKECYDIFIKFISKNFKKTFVITGNHEYYNKTYTIPETDIIMSSYFKQFDNISLLNNTFELYDNHCFIGSTMWSNITDFRYKINDVKKIPNFNCTDYNQLNSSCVDFLKNSISKNDNCIVITHHMPSESLIHQKYKTLEMQLYNKWFYCDMDDVIKNNKDKIKAWIYGHTHTPLDATLDKVPVICNPIGYPNENTYSDFSKTIELTESTLHM